MKTIILGLAALGFLASASVVAAAPAHDVSGKRHPNLSAAQRLAQQAFQKIGQAQKANEFDLGGHAAHAKELLDEANNELKAAATTSNESK